MLKIAHKVENGDRGQDRIAIDRHENHWIIVVADGAGGTGGGSEAAEAVCEGVISEFRARSAELDNVLWDLCLGNPDKKMVPLCHGGLTTAVVVAINNGRLSGASVGDSAAWLVSGTSVKVLTENQQRKPFLGSGAARPIGFQASDLNSNNGGRLLVGTDGLFKYAPEDRIATIAKGQNIDQAVTQLVDAVRLSSGALADDIAVVLCEPTA